MTAKTGHVGGGGGGKTRGGGGMHESDRAASDVLEDFEDFFGVDPFAGPAPTLGDLMSIDEPISAAVAEANKLWLRTAHPDHFFKDTDRIVLAAAERVDRIGSATESDRRRLRRSSESSRRKSHESNSTTNSNCSSNGNSNNNTNNNINGKNNNNHNNAKRKSDAFGGLGKENAGGLIGDVRRDEGGEKVSQGLENARRNGGDSGPGGAEDGTRTRSLKRRRENGGVLASTCSSAANKRGKTAMSGPRASQVKQDPMTKKLLEFKQKKALGVATGSRVRTTDGKFVSSLRSGPSSRSVVSRNDVTRNGVSRGAGLRSAVSRGAKPSGSFAGAAGVGGGAAGVRAGAGLFSQGVSMSVSKAANNASLKPSSSSSVNISGGKGTASAVPIRAASVTITKPVTMVKRSVGGAAVAGVGKYRSKAGAGGRRVGTEAGGEGGGRHGSARGSGVHGTRRFAKGERETAQQGADSSALSFDDELKAKLEAHNKVLKKGKHTYEPAASVKDCRMWEKKTGKKYGSLSWDERADANKEIEDMRASAKGRLQERS